MEETLLIEVSRIANNLALIARQLDDLNNYAWGPSPRKELRKPEGFPTVGGIR